MNQSETLDSLISTILNKQPRPQPAGKKIRKEKSLPSLLSTQDSACKVPQELYITTGSYKGKMKSIKWTLQEMDQFYSLLRQFGSDFTCIQYMLRSKNIKQIRNKFKKEQKINPTLIDSLMFG